MKVLLLYKEILNFYTNNMKKEKEFKDVEVGNYFYIGEQIYLKESVDTAMVPTTGQIEMISHTQKVK